MAGELAQETASHTEAPWIPSHPNGTVQKQPYMTQTERRPTTNSTDSRTFKSNLNKMERLTPTTDSQYKDWLKHRHSHRMWLLQPLINQDPDKKNPLQWDKTDKDATMWKQSSMVQDQPCCDLKNPRPRREETCQCQWQPIKLEQISPMIEKPAKRQPKAHGKTARDPNEKMESPLLRREPKTK